VQVFSDHQNLEYFTTTKVLNRLQARWAQELAGIDFKIFYCPVTKNGKPDSLSRRSEYRPEKGRNESQPITTVLHKTHFAEPIQVAGAVNTPREGMAFIISAARLYSLPARNWKKEFLALVRREGEKDPEYRKALQELEAEENEENKENGEAARAGPVPDGRKAEEEEENGQAARAGPVPDGQKAKENEGYEEAVRAGPVPNGRMAKDRKAERKGMIEMKDGVVYRKGMLWIPSAGNLIRQILESEHDTKVAGHMGQDKTIKQMWRNFWWPRINEQITDFFRSCLQCQKNNAARHQPYGLLAPMELPYALWQSIAMDFITDLPLSEQCDQLWVLVDRFTKMAHFIPLPKEGKSASDLARTFAREVWRHHGLPSDIVSDRDCRITSTVWQEFLTLSGICPRMSTAFHPQTDGQTEHLNQTIEAYLRSFISYEQDDWVSLLPMAEFTYNNSNTNTTDISPFYANYGYHPTATNPAAVLPLNPASFAYGHSMHAVYGEVRKTLDKTRERMRRYTDPHRKQPPVYQVGDLVMLNGRNIQTRRPSRKLDHKNHGPFQVEKVISPLAVKLTLPWKWRIHDVFHVSLLEPYPTGEIQPIPYPVKVL